MDNKIRKTGYEWSLELNIRVLDLNNFANKRGEQVYFEVYITKYKFLDIIKDCKVKLNSTPRKTEKYLDWRMYGFVPYNLSGIQKGIQFGHAVVRYGRLVNDMPGLKVNFNRWADEYETFIILNGGTTNDNKDSKWYGSMQKLRDSFIENEVLIGEMKEPDLNDTLSSFCFLVDERVYNKELYPDYVNVRKPWAGKRNYFPNEKELKKWEEENDKNRKFWVDKIGGPNNDFLRNVLLNKKLA
tara:strand:+ start:14497 stop:15222 length:726 start_codon:yes stop_codon:yes gene_type:complete